MHVDMYACRYVCMYVTDVSASDVQQVRGFYGLSVGLDGPRDGPRQRRLLRRMSTKLPAYTLIDDDTGSLMGGECLCQFKVQCGCSG